MGQIILEQDYFKHFDIKRRFRIDLDLLRKKYYAISRNLHPDINNSLEDLDEKISQHNLAYKTLNEPISRLKYIIDLESGDLKINQDLSPEFLMEMMDLNEEIEQALLSNQEERIKKLIQSVDELENNLHTNANPSIELYDTGNRSEFVIASLVEYFVQLKYLRRLKKNLLKEEEM